MFDDMSITEVVWDEELQNMFDQHDVLMELVQGGECYGSEDKFIVKGLMDEFTLGNGAPGLLDELGMASVGVVYDDMPQLGVVWDVELLQSPNTHDGLLQHVSQANEYWVAKRKPSIELKINGKLAHVDGPSLILDLGMDEQEVFAGIHIAGSTTALADEVTFYNSKLSGCVDDKVLNEIPLADVIWDQELLHSPESHGLLLQLANGDELLPMQQEAGFDKCLFDGKKAIIDLVINDLISHDSDMDTADKLFKDMPLEVRWDEEGQSDISKNESLLQHLRLNVDDKPIAALVPFKVPMATKDDQGEIIDVMHCTDVMWDEECEIITPIVQPAVNEKITVDRECSDGEKMMFDADHVADQGKYFMNMLDKDIDKGILVDLEQWCQPSIADPWLESNNIPLLPIHKWSNSFTHLESVELHMTTTQLGMVKTNLTYEDHMQYDIGASGCHFSGCLFGELVVLGIRQEAIDACEMLTEMTCQESPDKLPTGNHYIFSPGGNKQLLELNMIPDRKWDPGKHKEAFMSMRRWDPGIWSYFVMGLTLRRCEIPVLTSFSQKSSDVFSVPIPCIIILTRHLAQLLLRECMDFSDISNFANQVVVQATINPSLSDKRLVIHSNLLEKSVWKWEFNIVQGQQGTNFCSPKLNYTSENLVIQEQMHGYDELTPWTLNALIPRHYNTEIAWSQFSPWSKPTPAHKQQQIGIHGPVLNHTKSVLVIGSFWRETHVSFQPWDPGIKQWTEHEYNSCNGKFSWIQSFDVLCNQFLNTTAWGQAVFCGGGNVTPSNAMDCAHVEPRAGKAHLSLTQPKYRSKANATKQ